MINLLLPSEWENGHEKEIEKKIKKLKKTIDNRGISVYNITRAREKRKHDWV